MRIVLRPTVVADLKHFSDAPLPHRIKALTAVAGDQVLGIGGIGYRPDGTVIAFAHITPGARKYPAAIHRAGLAAMAMIRAARVPMVIAEAEDGNPAAAPWLKRLGFVPADDVGRTFVWRRS